MAKREVLNRVRTVLALLLFLGGAGVAATASAEENADSDPVIITLMVVYTQEARDWADANGGGIDNVIAQGLALTQLTLDNSNLNVEVHLVHSALVNYTESGDSELDLARLRIPDDGHMDEIHEWRDRYNADLVKVLTYSGTWGGGVAYVPRGGPNADLGFSLTRIQAATSLTFAHELGHNFGFAHSRNQTENASGTVAGIFDYSTGWRWTGNDGRGYVSVMTYPEGDTRVPYFSNPDINYQGTPTGSYTGPYAPADNARTLREVKEYIAGYRGPAHTGDSLAVVSLYNSTNGQAWNDNTNWLSNELLKNWHGLHVMGRVIGLNLSGNNLSGMISSDIGQLSGLQSLYLWSNNLTGSIPSEVGELSNLSILILSSNALTGPIPSEIGDLSNLRTLDLANNDLSGPLSESLTNLTDLFTFRFHNTRLCIPSGAQFQAWLDSIEVVSGTDVHCEDVRPGIVQLLSPENHTEELPLDLTLQWEPEEFAVSYHVQVSGTIDFSDLIADDDEISTESVAVSGLESNTIFYWRVKALGEYMDGDWSETWSFTTIEAPEPVTLVSPMNGSLLETITPELVWESDEAAETYTLQLSGSEDFTSVYLETTLSATSFRVETPLHFSSTYYWRVRAANAGGVGEWSEIWSFETIVQKPEVVALLSPVNGSFQIPVSTDLLWEESERTENYLIQISEDPGFSSLFFESETSDTRVSDIPFVDATAYYWRVKAENAGGESDWSETWSFTTPVLATAIDQNYPNPFAGTTTVRYQLAEPTPVLIDLYDVAGRRVQTLVQEDQQPQAYELQIDSSNLVSGIYFLRFQTNGFLDVQKLMVIQ